MKFHLTSLHSLVYIRVILFFSINSHLLQANASGNDTDLLALLKFKEGITNDPDGILNSWNDSLPFCNWFGITCGHQHQRVTSLVLQEQNLYGTISPYIGNLSFLRYIDLQNNSLHGEIPQEFGNLFRLQQFMLRDNSLEGEIPVNLSHCSQFTRIDLSKNNVDGKIPAELGALAKLEMLRLSLNNLTGEIPPSLGNLSSLTFLSLSFNNLVGQLPDDMGQLTSLNTFYIGANKLSGQIPPSFLNISSILDIAASDNQLSGSLPDNIGLTLPNLQAFGIAGNEFFGSIPNSLSNASQLKILDIGDNKFVGQVPSTLGNLKSIRWLRLANNSLGSRSTNDLDFLTFLTNCSDLELLYLTGNNFGGVLPNSVANFSIQLSVLAFGDNHITGIIPAALDNLVNLTLLSMENNLLTGTIPFYFGNFQKLQGLFLSGNRLSGQIPSSIGNLTQLIKLILLGNNFEGSIPSSIGNCQNLNYLDFSQNNLSGAIPKEVLGLLSLSILLNLSQNLLTGKLPAEVGKLTAINQLDASENRLSGEIPSTIGDCMSLEYLYLQGNSFQGTIPSSLASLKGLQKLDLSQNNLTGEIPQYLQNVQFLHYLNLSFNDLEGEVPTGGVFKNASAIALVGNSKLCGSVPELFLPKCPAKASKKRKFPAFKLAIIIICVISSILIMSASVIFYWMRKSKKKSSSATETMGFPVKVSYKSLYQATGGFSACNLLGSGSFGNVYKGFFNQEQRPFAVKVLNLQKKGASKSFLAECKALRNIRHRNLVKTLTCCSSLDYKGSEFKALVFEFMSNGSLEKWLHPVMESQSQSRNLNLLERLNIAIDVASALHYLHDLCETPIIHCDLKPNNILLNGDMVAHVSDFGLARLLSAVNGLSESQTSTIGIKGTIGYTAPEYGMGGETSKGGDVYSYGILVLEMFSGRRPTEEMFKDGLNLHDFVKATLPGRFMLAVDPTLLPRDMEKDVAGEAAGGDNNNKIGEEEETDNNENLCEMTGDLQKCLLSILELGVACSAESPKARMNMVDVNRELHLIKKAFLGAYRPLNEGQHN